MNDIVRKLASIKRIDDIIPIENADSICQYVIGGWKVVDTIGKYQINDLILYFEIDSWIPTEIAPFLSKGKEPKEYLGIKGERLKTIKLRGALSQGLLLPITLLANLPHPPEDFTYQDYHNLDEGDDVTEILGIQKWEPPVNAQLAGQTKGTFPHFIRKTDEERIQNIKGYVKKSYENGDVFEVSMKVDGSSTTIYHFNGEVGVCSRNQELKINEENEGNSFIKAATKTNALEALQNYGKNIAIQGECMAPGIQGNRENFKDVELFVFNIFDIDKQEYLPPKERHAILEELYQHGFTGKHVPIINHEFRLHTDEIDELLKLAEIPSINHKIAEGIVLKRHDGQFSFKIINNKFLLREE